MLLALRAVSLANPSYFALHVRTDTLCIVIIFATAPVLRELLKILLLSLVKYALTTVSPAMATERACLAMLLQILEC